MYEWFNRPHMKKWWGRGRGRSFEEVEMKYGPRVDGKERVFGYIVEIDGKPAGYIQYYPVSDFLPDGVTQNDNGLFQIYSKKEMAGLDVFIGEESLVGKGYGTGIIRAFLDEVVFPKYRVVVIDPQAANKRAIRVYEKCGFVTVPFSEDPGVLLMARAREA